MNSKRKEQAIYIICSAFLVLAPWILLFAVVLLSGGTLCNSHPVWNDELSYWHEILSFSEKGWNHGYYTFHEATPHFLSFGTHGFGTITMYATYAKILGWNYNSIVIANSLYISLSFLLLVLLVRLPLKKMLLIAFFYMSYMPLILYCYTSMSELMNYSLIIIYFTLLYSYIKTENHRTVLFIILLLLCTYMSFIRITYAVLFLPVFFEKRKISGVNLDFLKTIIVWVVLSIFLFVISSLFIAPYPHSYYKSLFSSPSFSEFLYVFSEHFVKSIYYFISPFRDGAFQVFQRYFILFFTIIFLWKSDIIKSKLKKWNYAYFVSFLILFLFILINISVYDIFGWRDYRVIAPILFGVIFFITLAENTKVLKLAIMFNILCLGISYSSFHSTGILDRKRYVKVETNEDLETVKYNDNFASPFDNTIVVMEEFEKDVILSIPAGIGISLIYHFDLDSDFDFDKLQSKYLYLRQEHSLKTYRVKKASERGILYEKIN